MEWLLLAAWIAIFLGFVYAFAQSEPDFFANLLGPLPKDTNQWQPPEK